MNSLDRCIRIGLIVAIIGACITVLGQKNSLMADTGYEAATRIERGSYASVRSVSLTTATGVNLWSGSNLRPDGLCRNNSAYTIWIGTDTTSYIVGDAGPNVRNGLPVLSSETFKLDGSFRGSWAATADAAAGAAGANVRCADGLVY